MKKKSLISRLIPWLITAVIIAAIVIFIGIPLYGPQPVADHDDPVRHQYAGGKTHLVMENDALRFELDPVTTQFTVTDKATGEVWYSNPVDASSDTVALAANKDMLYSTLQVSYSNEYGTTDLCNYKAIQNECYEVEVREDGSIAVTYAIGYDPIYIIPVAIPKADFDAWMEIMGSKTAKKVKSNYTLYEPAKLATKDNAEELIEMYPNIVNEPMYVLKSDTNASNRLKLQGYFADAGYTMDNYEHDQQYVAVSTEVVTAAFDVTIVYRLEGNDLIVEVPYDEIRYRTDYSIVSVCVLPMFGAVNSTTDGYLFVPEGGGALIRCNNGKLTQNSYYANVYGWDYGSERTEVVSETRVNYPVFGIIHENASFICMMEGASVYGGVQADISMRYNSYNYVNAKYTVLHTDKYNVSAKTEKLVYMYEKEIPHTTVVQRYRFLNTTSYVDMAAAYGEYLTAHYPELADRTSSEEVPVSIELIGAIDKKVVKFGLPIDSVVATTTFAQAQTILNDLLENGVTGLNVRYNGWSNGGINQKVMTGVKTVRQLGGDTGLTSLISYTKANGMTLCLEGVSCFAYDSGLLEGFIPFRDAARLTTREQIKIYPYDVITYLQSDWLDPFYLVKPSFADRCATNFRNKVTALGAQGIAYRDIGYLLSGNYSPADTVTREQVLAQHLAQLTASAGAGLKIVVNQGNDYALPYVDLITNMDLNGMAYTILDQHIPFYQIAIHGRVDYTGLSLNLAGNWQQELLTCAEYGAGISFTFMYEDPQILQDTVHSSYCGTHFSAWRDDAIAIINRYRTEMAGLNRQAIVNHETFGTVSATTYADGTVVYVNYGTSEAVVNGVTIAAKDYHVERTVNAQ